MILKEPLFLFPEESVLPLSAAQAQSLCLDYWRLDPEDNTRFGLSVKQLLTNYNLPRSWTGNKLSQAIEECCTVRVRVGSPCSDCTNTFVKTCSSRTDAITYSTLRSFVCPDCTRARVAAERAAEEAALAELHRRKREVVEVLGPEAYEKEIYASLKPIEMRVLIELALADNDHDAYKRIGISRQRGNEIFGKLVKMSLVAHCSCHGYMLPNGAKEKLTRLKEDVKLKPILNPMEKEIYRRLKSQNAVIFPHQLLRTFVPEHVAREVLAKFPDVSFGSYLCMEVDFLICDDEYRPLRAIEYQGGYHSNPEQSEKDEFKALVCNAAGVPLTAFEKSSLWKAEELAEMPST